LQYKSLVVSLPRRQTRKWWRRPPLQQERLWRSPRRVSASSRWGIGARAIKPDHRLDGGMMIVEIPWQPSSFCQTKVGCFGQWRDDPSPEHRMDGGSGHFEPSPHASSGRHAPPQIVRLARVLRRTTCHRDGARTVAGSSLLNPEDGWPDGTAAGRPDAVTERWRSGERWLESLTNQSAGVTATSRASRQLRVHSVTVIAIGGRVASKLCRQFRRPCLL
jgi:hypothetical protein